MPQIGLLGKSRLSALQSARVGYRDLTQFWDQTEPAEFEVDIQSEVTYYPVDITLSAQLAEVARRRGISAETLLNLWVQERLVTSAT